MKKSIKNQIVVEIKRIIHKTGLSQNDFGTQHGISSAHMTNILNERHWGKVSATKWVELQHKFGSKTWEIQPTQNLITVQSACREAAAKKRFIGISAYTGAGKTTALKAYKYETSNIYYVLCDSAMSKRDLLLEVAEAMSVSASDNRFRTVQKAIVAKMLKTKNCLLILDSASKLGDTPLQWIGDLAELTEDKAGIVIAGTEYLREYLSKMARKNKRGFREFKRRVFKWKAVLTFDDPACVGERKQMLDDLGIKGPQAVDAMRRATCYGSFANIAKQAVLLNKKLATTTK